MQQLVHYWQLPNDIYISLKEDYHNIFCGLVREKTRHNFKNCFYKVLNCPKWHAQRLFNKEIRFTIKELEILREFAQISKDEIEKNIGTLGNHEDGTIIKNPELPFNLKDIVYVASHLMFDGSFRYKEGCYFYVYDKDLLEYHKERIKIFGNVPTNFIEKENQLYFSYTLGYIASKILEIDNFRSLQTYLSDKLKILLKGNKIFLDEFIKAMIIDEGAIEDKIKIELGDNKRFVDDIYEVILYYYKLNKVITRVRNIYFKKYNTWNYNKRSWRIDFNFESLKLLYESLKPLPIKYKQKNFELLYKRQKRGWYKRKPNETKKLIISSLLEKPKSILELASEMCIKNGTVISHIKGHQTYSDSLIKLRIVSKVEERILEKGGYTKADIFGVTNKEKAQEYLKN